MKRRILVAVLTGLAWGCAVATDPPPDVPAPSAVEQVADREAASAIADGRAAGLSVAVRQGDTILFAKGYGFADLENRVPATAETVYRIGSITKQFTAAAIMRLVEAGQVDLDADLRTYVDAFDTGDNTVTITHLLTHTSGIKSYTGLGEAWRRTVPVPITHGELLALIQPEPFDFAPGEQWRYNNSGYYLLGMVIEEVTGTSYGDHVETVLAAPLGLDSTLYCDEQRLIPDRAEGYERRDDALVNDEPIDMTHPFAAGAMCSDVNDLLRWQAALAGGEVVSAESYDQMTTAALLNDGSATSYGFGLGIGDLEGHRVVRHGGGINGFVTMLSRYPDDGLEIVVLTNTPGPTAPRIEGAIARAALGLASPEPAEEQP